MKNYIVVYNLVFLAGEVGSALFNHLLSGICPEHPSDQQVFTICQRLRLHITQAASEARFKDINDEYSSGTDSDVQDLVLALAAIKERRYLAERVRLERAPDNTQHLFGLDTARFKQQFRMSQDSSESLLSLYHKSSRLPQQLQRTPPSSA
ncbi:hypothetical protein VP01_2433g1 [Puccinia sorghi]|uniref:Uncharacterized protein n=1 Tax=Puccinia sorghi TaxID=27349 RepID=A0A0L6V6H6_9BASI|nr:hypothetical protein VP01_2433g1 [Puccinia sorghi]